MNKKGRFDYISQTDAVKEEMLTQPPEEEEEEEELEEDSPLDQDQSAVVAEEPDEDEEPSEVLPVTQVARDMQSDGALQLGLHVLMHAEQYTQPPQRRGKKAAENAQNRMNIPREQMNIRIRPELKQAAAMLAGAKRLSLGDVVEAALVEYLKKHAPSGPPIK